jgi:hypothetical protein
VHSYEGAWTSNTGNGYYGGFQMNIGFQAAYGPWMLHHFGTANRWPKSGQLYASWKAWKVRGWQPWPNTALMCGLSY